MKISDIINQKAQEIGVQINKPRTKHTDPNWEEAKNKVDKLSPDYTSIFRKSVANGSEISSKRYGKINHVWVNLEPIDGMEVTLNVYEENEPIRVFYVIYNNAQNICYERIIYTK